jgi:hypothetical protein
MKTVIDSLVVKLGLDSSKFTKGQKDSVDSLRKLEQQSKKTTSELEASGKKAAQAFSSLKGELLAIGALLAGGFGLKDFIAGTIQQTAALGRMSTNLEMSKVRLAEWQHAVVLAGGSAEEATSQIQKSQEILNNYKMTGNLGSQLGAMAKWSGYGGKKFNPSEFSNADDLLKSQADLLRAIAQKRGTSMARTAASEMGISSENFFNILKNGSSELEKNLESQRALAESEAKLADQSEDLRKETIKLQNQFKALALEVMPAVLDGLKSFEKIIGSDETKRNLKSLIDGLGIVANYINEFAKSMGWVVARLTGKANDDYKAEGGASPSKSYSELKEIWEQRKRNAARMTKSSFDAGSNAPISSKATDNQKYAINKLVKMGWTPAQAAGMVGSLTQESNVNPDAINPDSKMYGIAQWDTNRRKDFQKLTGRSIQGSSLNEQLEFMNWELNNTEKKAGEKIRSAQTAADAALAHSTYYERASKNGKWGANDDARIKMANSLLEQRQATSAANLGNLPLAFKPNAPTAGSVSNNNVDTNINTINIHTQATDANGISHSINDAMTRNFNFGLQNANTGLS